MAFDHKTGQMRWYNQVLPHDLFDHDLQISPILTTIVTASGVPQDIVISAGKMGYVYAFDRQTGELLWKTPVGIHNEASELDALPPGTTSVIPSVIGGVETPMAYSDGVIYVPVVDMFNDWTPNNLVPSSIDFNNAKGELVAIDATTGKILWFQSFESTDLGGATVVNDVVFTGTYNGWIYGFQTRTGDLVYKFKAPAGINAWPSIVDDTIIWPCGVGGIPSVIALRPATAAVKPEITSITVETAPPSGSPTPSASASPTQTSTSTVTPIVTTPATGTTAVASATVTSASPSASGSPTRTASPSPSATPSGPPVADVKVTIKVSNFNLVNKSGSPAASGEGHILYFMDAQPPTTTGISATTDPGSFAMTPSTTYTWRNVTAGIHTFSTELVNNDHTPLSPPVVSQVVASFSNGPDFSMAGGEVTMTMPSPTPTASPSATASPSPTRTAASPTATSPSPSPTMVITCTPVVQVMSADVKISVNSSNFNIVNKIGQAAVSGQGHIRYFMDVVAPVTSGKPATTGATTS